MLRRLRRGYANLVSSGTQLVLLFGVAQADDPGLRTALLGLMAGVSFAAWLSALHRLRSIRGTPTSRIASAAQGYVELAGRGRPHPEAPLISKLRGLPCLWYRYQVEEQRNDKWHTLDEGESADPFLLRDNSGECVVDPDQAEIVTKHRDRWSDKTYRYTEWKLIQDDSIYVLGEFSTRNPGTEFDPRTALNALLAEWKRDLPTLHARFDLDNNGELDMQEWMLARRAAQREVEQMRHSAQQQPDLHLIACPKDGKLFLLSNLTPERLSRRYLFWSWAHLAIFFSALAGIGWLAQA